jgi:CRISPR-associated protein Cas2
MIGHLLTSDIADPRRLQRAARICERYGERVQESVYWLTLDPDQLRALQGELAAVIRQGEDSLRYYPICSRDFSRSTGEGLCRGLALPPDHWLI